MTTYDKIKTKLYFTSMLDFILIFKKCQFLSPVFLMGEKVSNASLRCFTRIFLNTLCVPISFTSYSYFFLLHENKIKKKKIK